MRAQTVGDYLTANATVNTNAYTFWYTYVVLRDANIVGKISVAEPQPVVAGTFWS